MQAEERRGTSPRTHHMAAPRRPDRGHGRAQGMANTQDSDILQYLTEEHCAAAHKLELSVSLHMVRLLLSLSAVPSSPFGRCFNTDGEGVPAESSQPLSRASPPHLLPFFISSSSFLVSRVSHLLSSYYSSLVSPLPSSTGCWRSARVLLFGCTPPFHPAGASTGIRRGCQQKDIVSTTTADPTTKGMACRSIRQELSIPFSSSCGLNAPV